LINTTPGDGDQVVTAPDAVDLRVGAAVREPGTTITVVGAKGSFGLVLRASGALAASPTSAPSLPAPPVAPAVPPSATPTTHRAVGGMDPNMPGMVGSPIADAAPPLSAFWAVLGLVLLVVLVVAAMVIERMRRKPSAADPPGPSSD
jgi:hypothetical protein